MEFEIPSIFKNNKDVEDSEESFLSKFNNDLQNREAAELYKPCTPSTSSDEQLSNINISNTPLKSIPPVLPKKYIGLNNIKLINEISFYILNALKTKDYNLYTRLELFYILDEVFCYLSSNPSKLNTFNLYNEDIKFNLYKQLDNNFVDYVIRILTVNIKYFIL